MNKDTRLSDELHVLLHLGHAKEPITSEVLARTMGTNPDAVFRRTMAGLRAAGHVSAEKGHGGGWLLARPLHEISLLDVYVANDSEENFLWHQERKDGKPFFRDVSEPLGVKFGQQQNPQASMGCATAERGCR